ncbi:MAG TPA: response regulator, partial [Planctomycetota bacterium]|nr:response regulator [Planctomycetota bacterium]
MTIRVVLAEDQAMVRGALVALLELEEDIRVVGQAASGEEAWELLRSRAVDVLVTDIEMPGLDGLALATRVKEAGLPCKVVVLTTFARPGYLRRALDAGAAAYLLK